MGVPVLISEDNAVEVAVYLIIFPQRVVHATPCDTPLSNQTRTTALKHVPGPEPECSRVELGRLVPRESNHMQNRSQRHNGRNERCENVCNNRMFKMIVII